MLPMGSILAGKYLIGRALGQGGFGITYIGWDMALERKVAVKEFYPSGQVSRTQGSTSLVWYSTEVARQTKQDGMGMFLKEARKMSRADGVPGVVRVQDLFQENNTAYIIMDFVEGQTLKSQLKKTGPMPWSQAKNIFLPAIQTMERVHRLGIIHRDISPDNLMLTPDGSVKILDLGAAKDLSINSGLSSMQVAKSGFSPWEQYLQQGGSGPWTDVYSMAATIYYTLTGKLPPNAVDRANQDTISWTEPGLQTMPPSVLAALQKAMAVQSRYRLQSMESLEKGLFEEIKPAPAPKAESIPPKAPQKKETRKPAGKRWLIPAAAVLVLCLGAIVLRPHKAPTSPVPTQSTTASTSEFDADTAYIAMLKTWTEHVSALEQVGTMRTYLDGQGQERCRIYEDLEGKRQFVVTAEYNSDGKIIQERCYDGDGNLKWAEQSTWSQNGWLLSDKLVDGSGRCIEESESTQDAQGRIVSRIQKNGEGEILQTSTFEYKANDSVVVTDVYADGKMASVDVYDKEKRLLSYESYNADGSLRSWCENTYNGGDKPIKRLQYTSEGALEYETHFEYDGDQCIRETLFHNGTEAFTDEYVYNAYGELLYTCYTYQSGSSSTEITFCSIGGRWIRHYQMDATESEYASDSVSQFDERGNLILRESYDKNGKLQSVTNYEYDRFGHEESHTYVYYWDDTYTVTQYNENYDPISKVTYDYDDVKTEWTEYTYSKNSRTDKTYDKTGTLSRVEEYQYDDHGNELKRKVYDASGKLSYENIYEYDRFGHKKSDTFVYYSDDTYTVTQYNENHDPISEVTYDYNDVKTKWTEYTYSKNSRTDKTYDETGTLSRVEEHQYDDHGNELKRKEYDASGKLSHECIYTYKKGVRTGITSIFYNSYDGTKYVTEYDGDWNELSKKTYDANGKLISSK